MNSTQGPSVPSFFILHSSRLDWSCPQMPYGPLVVGLQERGRQGAIAFSRASSLCSCCHAGHTRAAVLQQVLATFGEQAQCGAVHCGAAAFA